MPPNWLNVKYQMSNAISQMSNVISLMSNVNKVKHLSERTSGVPPVIFIAHICVKSRKYCGKEKFDWCELKASTLSFVSHQASVSRGPAVGLGCINIWCRQLWDLAKTDPSCCNCTEHSSRKKLTKKVLADDLSAQDSLEIFLSSFHGEDEVVKMH